MYGCTGSLQWQLLDSDRSCIIEDQWQEEEEEEEEEVQMEEEQMEEEAEEQVEEEENGKNSKSCPLLLYEVYTCRYALHIEL